ncbi:iron ABC transporter ATP-binding protein [Gilliamella sp. wkB178]|uniref:ABC transporter ATP-binding protein n=1 Tax=Gilliamella sp. wkB178 TaxID=3120259 RepID=UPI00080DBA96|nr:ABC transporter ATP-binding protein [Gilliamella apicola]OCG07630.1 iron ABC transporter ATP-binding protein [Gilliamella apicola]
MSNLIELKNVTIGYTDRLIATHLNLCLQDQQIVCLLGANGCGKTTLLKTILAILPLKAGQIFINQIPLAQWSKKALAQFIAYVPQTHNFVFPFTTQEMILMGRSMHLNWYSVPSKKDLEIAQQCMVRVGISHLQSRTYNRLSGGEKQLVLIARALAQQPTILIMDEPTSSLDYGNQIRVLELIKSFRQQGLTILLTMHQPEHAFDISDRVILFDQGKILADDTPATSLTIDNLAQIYSLDKSIISKNLRFIK